MTATAKLRVRLLMGAGHVREWTCDAGDPLIHGLLSALPGASLDPGLPPDGLIQINAGAGQRLFITRSSLVAIEIDDIDPPPAAEPVPIIIHRDFLDAALAAELLADAIALEQEFSGATVFNAPDDFRQARVLHDFPKRWHVERALRVRMAQALRDLKLPQSPRGKMEIQLTASGDGNYYKPHSDSGAGEVSGRMCTFVYYLHRQPRPYGGGELRMFDRQPEKGGFVAAESFVDVEPEHNMLVLFPSEQRHEVRKVSVPSLQFGDGRFTINGWLHRAPKS
ncbi:MAG TPA: 2OG-Fe(II) oxygenase [Roseomonas sp.]|jgi:Rps23 Pro-64 3,4-dihydroxylase Tpa1-like proline 4-hydroxylase